MRLALDGSLVLFGASADNTGKLLYRPVVDPRGVTFVATPLGRTEVLRRDGLDGGPAAMSALSSML